MHMPLKFESLKKQLVLPLATITLLLFVIGNFLQQQAKDKHETIHTAIERNNNLVVALENSAIRTIQIADATLQLLKTEFQRSGYQMDIQKILYENSVNKDLIKRAAIIDTNGYIVKLNLRVDTSVEINVQDRDYFRFHKTHDTDIVFVNKPVISRSIGKPVIVISRRVNKNGKFAGVVSVQVEPASFTSFYAQANLRPRDIISLIAPDGITYARRTGNVESSGENISKSPLFQHLQVDKDSFYFAPDAIRGVPTWFSYRQLKSYPIIATVGTAEEDILQPYYKRYKQARNSTFFICLLIVLFAVFVHLYMQKEKHFQQQLGKQVVAAQEREREVIGRELHDNVNQVLTTAKLYLELSLINKEGASNFIDKSMELLAAAIHEIRNLSHRLCAPMLASGLLDALQTLCDTTAAASGVSVQFKHLHADVAFSTDQALALYRIAQEQLHNILKHAKAHAVDMILEVKDGYVYLTITDDGVGFNPSAKRSGVGINNIINRVKIFNGNVNIKSSPGKGCRLEVAMPI